MPLICAPAEDSGMEIYMENPYYFYTTRSFGQTLHVERQATYIWHVVLGKYYM